MSNRPKGTARKKLYASMRERAAFVRDLALPAIGLSPGSFYSLRKPEPILSQRHAVYYAMRYLGGASYPAIADMSNRLQHTGVYSGILLQEGRGTVLVGSRLVTNDEWLQLVADAYVLETAYTGMGRRVIRPAGKCKIRGAEVEPHATLNQYRHGAGRSGSLLLRHSA